MPKRHGAGPGGRNMHQGIFGMYEAMDGSFLYPPDEEAVASIIDSMFEMCGNAGQEALIGEAAADFEGWAMEALEVEGASIAWDDFTTRVLDWYQGRTDKWEATDWIWELAFAAMETQSHFHDRHDEQGEGTGDPVG